MPPHFFANRGVETGSTGWITTKAAQIARLPASLPHGADVCSHYMID
jgi:hypothetical protein